MSENEKQISKTIHQKKNITREIYTDIERKGEYLYARMSKKTHSTYIESDTILTNREIYALGLIWKERERNTHTLNVYLYICIMEKSARVCCLLVFAQRTTYETPHIAVEYCRSFVRPIIYFVRHSNSHYFWWCCCCCCCCVYFFQIDFSIYLIPFVIWCVYPHPSQYVFFL